MLRPSHSFITQLIFFIVITSSAYAQVNIEVARPKDQPGARVSVDAGLNTIRGNVNLTQVNLGTRAQYIHGVHSPFIQASVAYGEKEDEAFLDQSFVHVRWTAMWWKNWGTETFIQWQADAFRSLILRQLYGVGLRALLYQNTVLDVAVGAGYMLERETYLELDREQLDINHRSTNYLTFHYKVKSIRTSASKQKTSSKQKASKKSDACSTQNSSTSKPSMQTLISLNNTTYAQPLFNQIDDFRILNDLSLSVQLSTYLQLVETLSIMYDSAPPQNVKNMDLKSMTSIRLNF